MSTKSLVCFCLHLPGHDLKNGPDKIVLLQLQLLHHSQSQLHMMIGTSGRSEVTLGALLVLLAATKRDALGAASFVGFGASAAAVSLTAFSRSPASSTFLLLDLTSALVGSFFSPRMKTCKICTDWDST